MLYTRLSQLLVAFTIECDNEFELRMPHRTSLDHDGVGPWLISMVMWANYLRLVPREGLPLRDLAGPAGVPKLSGLQRWGYLSVKPDPADPRPVPPAKDWLVRLTRWGLRAQETWRPIAGEVEARWRDRFGSEVIVELRKALLALTSGLDADQPRYMRVLGYGLADNVGAPFPGPLDDDPDLSVLLSHILIAYTRDFEAESRLSLALCADVLRLIEADGAPVASLPLSGGVSKEAIAMGVGFLEAAECVEVGGKPKLVRLTSKGSRAKQQYEDRVADLAQRWRVEYGAAVADLTKAVEVLVARPQVLAEGLQPPPGAWRARKPYKYQTAAMIADPWQALPHHPMVLHRGGYPDGS